MDPNSQYLLFEKTPQEQFDEWVHTPYGREVANKFIRLAWGIKKRGFEHYSHWAIAARLRFYYDMRNKKTDADDGFKINNNWLAYLARMAMDREPKLKGFFAIRELGPRSKKNKAVVIPIKNCP